MRPATIILNHSPAKRTDDDRIRVPPSNRDSSVGAHRKPFAISPASLRAKLCALNRGDNVFFSDIGLE